MSELHHRLWRALVRVVSFDKEADPPYMQVVVPAWSTETVTVPLKSVTQDVIDALGEQTRFHVWVNIGARSADELTFDEDSWRCFDFDEKDLPDL